MDQTTQIIVDFVDGLSWDAVPASTRHEASRRLVDTLGAAVGGMDSRPAQIARSIAADVTGTLSATAIGLPRRTTAELAAFTNTVMLRYLDCNDTYFSDRGGGGHPSDLIPTALALGQAVGATGRDVLLAIVLGYEIQGSLAGAVWLRQRGWDQGLYVVLASAMMAGKLLGLSRSQLADAVALAVTPNIPVRQTRVGQLSMWKAAATAGAARNGIFAAVLASRGMTGPGEPFEGSDGLWQRVTGPFQMDLAAREPGGWVVERSHLKARAAEHNAQGPLDLILAMREYVDVQEVERIDVETYFLTYDEIGSQPAKWDPQTRETADHSLPYLLAVALIDGKLDQASFAPERVLDPTLRPLMQRIHIAERPEFTRRFPAELPNRIAIRLRSGECIARELSYPRGNPRNPMTDDEINQKFDSLVSSRAETEAALCRELRRAFWSLETVTDVATVLEPLGELRPA